MKEFLSKPRNLKRRQTVAIFAVFMFVGLAHSSDILTEPFKVVGFSALGVISLIVFENLSIRIFKGKIESDLRILNKQAQILKEENELWWQLYFTGDLNEHLKTDLVRRINSCRTQRGALGV